MVAQQRVPLRSMQRRHRLMALMLVLMVLIVAAAVGLSMVDDREGGQLDALRSSPLSVDEYLLAHGLMGCELSLIVVLSCAGILTGWQLPWWLIPAAWVALVPSAALLTLCLCVVARSQMTAMWFCVSPFRWRCRCCGRPRREVLAAAVDDAGAAGDVCGADAADRAVDALAWERGDRGAGPCVARLRVKRRRAGLAKRRAERRTVPRYGCAASAYRSANTLLQEHMRCGFYLSVWRRAAAANTRS